MARATLVRLTDDLDGSEATTTVPFAWDGVSYQIDLNSANAEAFAAAVQPYVAAARRTGSQRRGGRPAGGRKDSGRGQRRPVDDLAAIRAWASENGHAVATRGRISSAVIEAYRAARSAANPGAQSDQNPRGPRPASSPARATTVAKTTAPQKAAAKKASPRKTAAKRAPARKATSRTAAKKSARTGGGSSAS